VPSSLHVLNFMQWRRCFKTTK